MQFCFYKAALGAKYVDAVIAGETECSAEKIRVMMDQLGIMLLENDTLYCPMQLIPPEVPIVTVVHDNHVYTVNNANIALYLDELNVVPSINWNKSLYGAVSKQREELIQLKVEVSQL